MNALPEGWHAEASWGRDGWDLGAWPLIAVALYADDEHGRYAAATFVEGDVTIARYASHQALNAGSPHGRLNFSSSTANASTNFT